MTNRALQAMLKALPPMHRAMFLAVEPGDVIVIETPALLTVEQQESIRQLLKTVWPTNRALVLTGGMKLMIGTERNGDGHDADADADDEMAHPATLRLLTKAGADVVLADVVGWTRAQREEARTWALQMIDAQQQEPAGPTTRWPDHVSRAHRRRPPRAHKSRR